MQLLPADRLPPVAARLLAAQPDPPRRVSANDVLEIAWPVLVYLPIPALVVVALVLLAPTMNKAILVYISVLALLTIGVWIRFQVWPSVTALRNGMSDVGTVVDVAVLPRSGYRGHLRLEHGASTKPAEFYALSLRSLKVGERLKVLVDPRSGKVMTIWAVPTARDR